MDVDTPYIIAQQIILLARETDSIRQQIYVDYWSVRHIIDSISSLGFKNVKRYLNGTVYAPIEMKKDFNFLPYWNFNIYLTKGSNTIFISNFWNNYSLDSIPETSILEHIAVLIEPDYDLYLGDSIYIQHASKVMDWTSLGHFDYCIHIFTYDRKRQLIVASKLRDRITHKLMAEYRIEKIIQITGENFYEFWDNDRIEQIKEIDNGEELRIIIPYAYP
jgi:hypothetical protein